MEPRPVVGNRSVRSVLCRLQQGSLRSANQTMCRATGGRHDADRSPQVRAAFGRDRRGGDRRSCRAFWPRGRAPPMPREPRCTGCAGPISSRPPISCSRGRSRRNARRRSASSSRSRRSTPTTSRRASPRRSSPAPAPTSSWRSTTGRSSMPRASPMSATSPTRSARSRAAITTSARSSRRSAANGSACPGASAAGSSPIASPGWPRRVHDKFPATWDEYRAAGKKLKAAGRPYGQTAGHTFGDAPGWWYPYLWSWGGKEVEADGKTVVLNSKETIESVKFAVPLWKETMDEGGLAWDDTNNNRAFLSGSDQRHQQRRLDLSRGQEKAGHATRPRRARR